MFFRRKKVRSKGHEYEYLQLVGPSEKGKNSGQEVLANLGRLDQLRSSGELERLISELVMCCQGLHLVHTLPDAQRPAVGSLPAGAARILDALWQQDGLLTFFNRLAASEPSEDIERSIFALILYRLMARREDRTAATWLESIHAEGCYGLSTVDLSEALALMDREKCTIEQHLRTLQRGRQEARGNRLFASVDMLALDDLQASRGGSVGRRKQPILSLAGRIGVVFRKDGNPVACESLPLQASCPTGLLPALKAVCKRLQSSECVAVLDLEEAAPSLDQLFSLRWSFIVAGLVRTVPQNTCDALNAARWLAQTEVGNEGGPNELSVAGQRFICWRDAMVANVESQEREAVLEQIRKYLSRHRVSRLVGSDLYSAYLSSKEHRVVLDEAKVQERAKWDGLHLLWTNTDRSPAELIAVYREHLKFRRWCQQFKRVPIGIAPNDREKEKEFEPGTRIVCVLACHLAARLEQKLSSVGMKADWQEGLRVLNTLWLEARESHLERSKPMREELKRLFDAVGVKAPHGIQQL